MKLTSLESEMLEGKYGRATRKAMEILVALGTIYAAEKMVPVSSVQIAGVSYDNLGEAGLRFLAEMADGGGKSRVLTTLNPAGMDVENWQALGINDDFARDQMRVIETFARMGVITTCTCTPYLVGNLPHFGEHIAWAESSAVCYANSVLGARTNREGGPSAIAASLTGRTPLYGFHLAENRIPSISFKVDADLTENHEFGALGIVIGKKLEAAAQKPVPYIQGGGHASLENLKSFCASLATYGGAALFHWEGITPESFLLSPPVDQILITQKDLEQAISAINGDPSVEADFISLGCPHLSIHEISKIAERLQGRTVKKTFWITTARPTKQIADRMGYTQVIEDSGAIIAADTCCVVAPIKGRFKVLATDSAKACYYAYAKNNSGTKLMSFDQVIDEALK
jgi:predicted aconitase